jgi:autotransporter-associated beta strand protein
MMRRAPFQVNPLALSVALLLATPVLALAQDIQTSSSTTITSEVSSVGTITVDNVDNLTQITGKVLGDAQQTLIKKGTGTLSLTADNGYAGGTNIQQGTLAISSDLGLGSGNNVAIGNGASLQTNANINISKDRTLVITGTSAGAAINTAGNNSEINGQITGAGKLVKKGDGSLTLNNQTLNGNNYTGGTLIDAVS